MNLVIKYITSYNYLYYIYIEPDKGDDDNVDYDYVNTALVYGVRGVGSDGGFLKKIFFLKIIL